MKEKRQGITKGTGSVLALIVCIIYTIMTVLFIVRHSLDLKLFILSVTIMIAMALMTVSMWIGFFSSKKGRIAGVSPLLARIGLIIKMVTAAVLVIGNFVIAAIQLKKITNAMEGTGINLKDAWNGLAEEASASGGMGISIPSYNQFLAVVIVIAIVLLTGLVMYIILGMSAISYVGNVKKSSKYGGIVKSVGIKISLIGFVVCNTIVMVFKLIPYSKIRGLYGQIISMANAEGESLKTTISGMDVDFSTYGKALKTIETMLSTGLKDLKDVGETIFVLPINSINLRYGIGMSTSAIVMDIIYIVLFVAFTVMVFLLMGNIKKASSIPISVAENKDKENGFVNNVNGEIGTTQLTPDDYNPNEYKLRKGTITCISGTDVGFVYTIAEGEELIIGKDPRMAHIVIGNEYKQVSRRHCGIKYDARTDSYDVIDYSSNGTYVNGTRKLTNGIYLNVSKGNDIYLATDRNVYRLG